MDEAQTEEDLPPDDARLPAGGATAGVCGPCREQACKTATNGPHPGLKLVSTIEVSSPSGRYAESVYRCDDCGAMLMHSDSRTQAPPHWMTI